MDKGYIDNKTRRKKRPKKDLEITILRRARFELASPA